MQRILSPFKKGSGVKETDPENIQLIGSIKGHTSSLHIAAFKGDLPELKKLILTAGPAALQGRDDKKQRTSLHYSVAYWDETKALQMTRAILARAKALDLGGLVNSVDRHGETPLQLAVKFRHPQVAQFLIACGADCNLVVTKGTNKGKTGLDLIYELMPQIMCPYLDNNIKFNMISSASGIPILDKSHAQLDYKNIIGNRTGWLVPDTASIYQTLKCSSDKRKNIILTHPLVLLFIFQKWRKISPVFITSIVFHVAWSLLCAWYLFYMFISICPHDPGENGTSCSIQDSWLRLCKILVVISSGFLIAKEICEFVTTTIKSAYFQNVENVGQIILICLVLFATVPILFGGSYPDVTVHDWHYIVASFGMLLPWLLIMLQVGKLWFGVYIEIFKAVCKSFLLFTSVFLPILVAFTLSLTILMPKYPAFQNLSALVKSLVMMTGEFEYEEMFSEVNLKFWVTGHIIFVLFLAIVTISLFNLLIGLNVSDIQGLRASAEIRELSSSLERIHLMEEFLIKCNRVLKCCGINMGNCFSLQNGSSSVKLRFDLIMDKMTMLEVHKRTELVDELKRLAYKNKSLAIS